MSSLFPATYTTTPHLFKKCIFSSYQPKESKKGDGVMLILASRPPAPNGKEFYLFLGRIWDAFFREMKLPPLPSDISLISYAILQSTSRKNFRYISREYKISY